MGRFSFFTKIKEKLLSKKRTEKDNDLQEVMEEKKENLYLPYIRQIMECILQKKHITYQDFFPVLVDGEEPEKTLFAAEELGLELNRMAILTNRSAYFEDYRDMMYEEQGLIIEIFPKEKENLAALLLRREGKLVILDFEKEEKFINSPPSEKILYIPVFKKRWENTENLDIIVPIGYNTVIVSGIDFQKKQPVLDKFEQAFYDKE